MSTVNQPPAPWGPAPQYHPPKKKRHTVRNVLLSVAGVFVVLIAVSAALNGGNKSAGGSHGRPPAGGDPSSTTRVDKGAGAKDASGDVKINACEADPGSGIVTGTAAIHNNSSGRSDYYIQVVFTDAAGTNIGSGYAVAQSIEGGQRAVADLFGTVTGTLAKCTVTTVQRTAS